MENSDIQFDPGNWRHVMLYLILCSTFGFLIMLPIARHLGRPSQRQKEQRLPTEFQGHHERREPHVDKDGDVVMDDASKHSVLSLRVPLPPAHDQESSSPRMQPINLSFDHTWKPQPEGVSLHFARKDIRVSSARVVRYRRPLHLEKTDIATSDNGAGSPEPSSASDGDMKVAPHGRPRYVSQTRPTSTRTIRTILSVLAFFTFFGPTIRVIQPPTFQLSRNLSDLTPQQLTVTARPSRLFEDLVSNAKNQAKQTLWLLNPNQNLARHQRLYISLPGLANISLNSYESNKQEEHGQLLATVNVTLSLQLLQGLDAHMLELFMSLHRVTISFCAEDAIHTDLTDCSKFERLATEYKEASSVETLRSVRQGWKRVLHAASSHWSKGGQDWVKSILDEVANQVNLEKNNKKGQGATEKDQDTKSVMLGTAIPNSERLLAHQGQSGSIGQLLSSLSVAPKAGMLAELVAEASSCSPYERHAPPGTPEACIRKEPALYAGKSSLLCTIASDRRHLSVVGSGSCPAATEMPKYAVIREMWNDPKADTNGAHRLLGLWWDLCDARHKTAALIRLGREMKPCSKSIVTLGRRNRLDVSDLELINGLWRGWDKAAGMMDRGLAPQLDLQIALLSRYAGEMLRLDDEQRQLFLTAATLAETAGTGQWSLRKRGAASWIWVGNKTSDAANGTVHLEVATLGPLVQVKELLAVELKSIQAMSKRGQDLFRSSENRSKHVIKALIPRGTEGWLNMTGLLGLDEDRYGDMEPLWHRMFSAWTGW